MKKYKILIPLLTISSLSLTACSLVSCGKKEKKEEEQTYTVTLHSNNGGYFSETEVDTYVISDIKTLSFTDCPTPYSYDQNYAFFAWFKDEACTQPFSEFGELSSDLDLYAGWQKRGDIVTHTVTLNANGGYFQSNDEEERKIDDVRKLSFSDCEIPLHRNSNMIFNGWFLDSSCTKPYTFNKILTSDLVIYAGWFEDTFGNALEGIETKEELQAQICSGSAIVKTLDKTASLIELSINTATNEDATFTLTNGYRGYHIELVDIAKSETTPIHIVLNNCCLIGRNDAVPLSLNANKTTAPIEITAVDGTVNCIYDARTAETEDGKGAISIKGDLTIDGTGELIINDAQTYRGVDKAIHCTQNLLIKDLVLSAFAISNTIRGNQSITIDNAKLNVVSLVGDGIKTNDDGVTKNVRDGDILIKGDNTNISINTTCDGISASHNLTIQDNPTISINTGTSNAYYYNKPVIDEQDMYIRVDDDIYSDISQYYYEVVFSNGQGESVSEVAKLKKITTMGGSNRYFYSLNRPYEYKSFVINLYQRGVDQPIASSTSMQCSTGSSNLDGVLINSISTELQSIDIEPSWFDYKLVVGSESQYVVENRGKTQWSSKGIKVKNRVTINGGNITFETCDDAIHASSGKYFKEGGSVSYEVGAGDVIINGGYIDVEYTPDDSIHADGVMTITNGTIFVEDTYEGLEAPILNISGGNITIFAADDSINASSAGKTKSSDVCITISGGYIDLTSFGGNVDGIDTNNLYVQSGGLVIVRGGSSTGRGSSLALDIQTRAEFSGNAVLICEGKTENAPKSYLKGTLSGREIGTYTLLGIPGYDDGIEIYNRYNYSPYQTTIFTPLDANPSWKS